MAKDDYDATLEMLQIQLVETQAWAIDQGLKTVIVFEGRDAAGKDGAIKRMTEYMAPRQTRVVALPKPNDRELTQWYFQRYVPHLPTAGEMVLFDRSWYNRAGVERVMGYTKEKDVERFLEGVPKFERWLVESGVILIKLWLEVGKKEQERRFRQRVDDPLRQWKLSPMDVKSYTRWDDYTRARDAMFDATSHPFAPWFLLHSNDKKKARLNGIKHILSQIPYKKIKRDKVKLPKRSEKQRYKEKLNLHKVKLVRDAF